MLFVIPKREHDGGAEEGVGLAEFVFEETFPGPVEQAEVVAMNDKPRRAGVGLDDVFRLGAGVFEPGGGMF